MKVTSMVVRNFRILVRSKTTLLVILLAPLLAVLLAAISFDNNNQYTLRVAAFGEEYPRIANQFLDDLTKNSFQVDRLKSADECKESVRQGRHHACMLFESDSRKQVSITMLVDFSKVNLVDHLLNKVSDKVSLKSSEISINITDALIRRIEDTREEVSKNRYIITSLTTGQENIGRQLDELNARLAAFDPKIDISGVQGLVVAVSEGKTTSQMGAVSRLESDLVQRVSALSNELDTALKGIAMSESDKNSIRLIISQNDDRVRKISDGLRLSSDLTRNDLESLKNQLNEVIDSLTVLQERVNAAKDVKMEANIQIRKLKGTLDDNLIKIVVLQTALNKIGASVENLKVSSQTPIKTDIQPISIQGTRLNMIFPTILVFLMMVSCTLLAASLVASHKQNPGSLRDSLMPVSPATRILAMFLTVVILSVLQAASVFAIAGLMLGPSVLPGMPMAAVAVLAIISTFSLLGMVLGFLFLTEQGAVIAGIAATSALFVFSDALLPIESMPPLVARFASMNPFVIGAEAVRRALLYEVGAGSVFVGVVALGVYSLALCAVLLMQHREKF